MQFTLKLIASVALILIASQVGRRFPSAAGLIATMPLTSLIVLMWLYTDAPANTAALADYAKGALWGIGPTILFFLVAWLCLRRGWSMGPVLAAGFAAWGVGAILHQTLLGK
jgi:hypothetical protein